MTTQTIPTERHGRTKTKTMKAFVMHGIGKVGFMQKPLPEDPGPNGAIV